jgi:hypothetical protein
MNIPDNFSESFERVFWVKNMVLKFIDADPGSGFFLALDPGHVIEKIQILDPG